MNLSAFKHLAVSLTPMWALIALVVLFIYPVNKYVQCVNGGCESIGMNLTKVMVPDDPTTRSYQSGDNEDTKRKKDIVSHQRTALMYSGRLNFLFLVMIYISLCVVTFFVACFLIYRCIQMTGNKPTKFVAAIGSATLAIGVGLYLKPSLHMRILLPLIQSTVAKDLSGTEQLIQLSNSCAFAVAFLLTFTSVMILIPINKSSYPNSLKQIATQMKYQRVILYLGTFILIAGVLMVRSLYQWSLAFVLRDDQAIKAAEGFFSILLAAEGGYFTLVLAAVYLPAAFILRHRADSLPGMPEDEEKKDEVLKKYDMNFSFSHSLPRVVAILGPLLAGPVGELFSRLVAT